MTCAHEEFSAFVDVGRIARSDEDPTIVGFSAEIRIDCAVCGEPMVFVGAPIGLMPNRPTIDPNGTELRVPLRPQSADPAFGLGVAGYLMRVEEGSPGRDN